MQRLASGHSLASLEQQPGQGRLRQWNQELMDWAHRGRPAPVLISGANARRTVFGTLHLRTGRLLCLEQTRIRAQEFQEFLDFLRWHYRGWPPWRSSRMKTPSTPAIGIPLATYNSVFSVVFI